MADGTTKVFDSDISGIETQNDLEMLFGCYDDTYLELTHNHVAFGYDKDEDLNVKLIIKAEWVDDDAETTMHDWVINYFNAEGVDAAFSLAEGNSPTKHLYTLLADGYGNGFQEAVNNQINLDGLDCVIGNEFCLETLWDLVTREIAREYLREHDLSD